MLNRRVGGGRAGVLGQIWKKQCVSAAQNFKQSAEKL